MSELNYIPILNNEKIKTELLEISKDSSTVTIVPEDNSLKIDSDMIVDGNITCDGVIIKNLNGTATASSPNADVDIETMNSGIVRIDNQEGGTVSIGALGNADIYIDNMTRGKLSVSNIKYGEVNLSSIEWIVLDDHSKDTTSRKSISYTSPDGMKPGFFYRVEFGGIIAVWLWDTTMEGALGFATTLQGGGANQDSMYAIKVWADGGFYNSASTIEFRKVYINIGDGSAENGAAYHQEFTGYRLSRSRLHFDDIKKIQS